MSLYPERITERLRDITNVGVCDGGISGRSVNFDCGCFVDISVDIDRGSQLVGDARFRSNGCGFMVAYADVMTGSLKNSSLTDLHGLGEDQLAQYVEKFLGTEPHLRPKCCAAVNEAVRAAFAEYRRSTVKEFAGGDPLVCTCFGVSEETIESFIRSEPSAGLDEVIDKCRAGGGCGSCRFLIREMLDARDIHI